MCTKNCMAAQQRPFVPPQTHKWLLVFVIPQLAIGIALIVCQVQLGGKHWASNSMGYWVGGTAIGAGISTFVFMFIRKISSMGGVLGNSFSSLGGCIAIVILNMIQLVDENWVGKIEPDEYKKYKDYTLVMLMLASLYIPVATSVIAYTIAGGCCGNSCPKGVEDQGIPMSNSYDMSGQANKGYNTYN